MNRALVVIDTQLDYAATGAIPITYPPMATSLANISQAMAAATAAGIPVVVVAQISPAGAWAFAKGSAGADLLPEVAAGHRDLLVEKTLPSSFTHTPLDGWLRERGIDRLALAGYMTQMCVETTAREAVHLGYSVELLADATGTAAMANDAGALTAREVHDSALVVLQSRFAAVGSTADWCQAVAAGTSWPAPDLAASVRRGLAEATVAS